MWIFSNLFQAFESFPAGNSRIHKNACMRAAHQRAVAAAAARQHCQGNSHVRRIPSILVEMEELFQNPRLLG
jgi:hypothetical protein